MLMKEYLQKKGQILVNEKTRAKEAKVRDCTSAFAKAAYHPLRLAYNRSIVRSPQCTAL